MDENGNGQCVSFRSPHPSNCSCLWSQKINQANSWNFALIDYFHDMSLLRNNVDNSINFQRASSTLDGCVKIWTSRVDSVGTETGKLLSNLASDGREAEDDEPTSDNPDSQEPSHKKRKPAHRSESTLAKNAAQWKSKKLDLEFSVDPLFRKTCEDFDEGGAHGLLMNHLGLGVGSEGALRVIFDASDSMGKVGEEEDLFEPEDDVDLTVLRSEGVPSLARSLLTSPAQMTSFQTWRFWTGRPFLIHWRTSHFQGTHGLLTRLLSSVMTRHLSKMTVVAKLMASDLLSTVTLLIRTTARFRKRTSLWATRLLAMILAETILARRGMVGKMAKTARLVIKLSFARLAPMGVHPYLSIPVVHR